MAVWPCSRGVRACVGETYSPVFWDYPPGLGWACVYTAVVITVLKLLWFVFTASVAVFVLVFITVVAVNIFILMLL